MKDPAGRTRMTRRSLLGAGAVTAPAPFLAPALAGAAPAGDPPSLSPGAALPMELDLNGQPHRLAIDPRMEI